ncbi:MAG: 1-deoxy-D-xylulose-5-phosphate synthase [Phycisphaerae bacterium]|nr:1-deoxy-D-xylulose-5-phosphate synthase [Phycisphaerae bacterium]
MAAILPSIQSPMDLKKLSAAELKCLASELRDRIISVVSANGGHLASNLGVVELTLALHRVFDFARDRLLWDVGHQAYVHKLLTGRNARFETLRKAGGVSGFPNIEESEYDLFNVGHAGTAIATATGVARGASLLGEDRRVVALVGDASIVNGVAFEGLNQAGTLRRQLLVVLNDNSMGIAPTQGGLAGCLASFRTSSLYEETKKRVKKYLPQVPLIGRPAFGALDAFKEGLKATLSPHQIFEQLGFIYVGPTDGHDVAHLIELLEAFKDVEHPVLLHVHTEKGRGADWATAEPTKFHSPKPFKVEGRRVRIQRGGRSWTAAFADALIDLAKKDQRIYALTAAMADGTGLDKFQEAFPDRCLDGGIAESGTLDIAAGMCKAGLRPVVAIYSTFLQRAFDQVFQEVVLQGLPVIFCMDRAGLVGGDGAVHHGFLDIAFLRGMPSMVLMAPGDGQEMGLVLELALKLNVPSGIRYPRDTVPDPLYSLGSPPAFELGRSVPLRDGDDATILAYGSTCRPALDAAELLAADGIEVRVVNARFAKPIDRDMLRNALGPPPLADGRLPAGKRTRARPVITVEEHSVSAGFGSAVLEAANRMGLSAAHLTVLGMPADRFIAHGSRSGQLAECGLDATGIAAAVSEAVAKVTGSPVQEPPILAEERLRTSQQPILAARQP